jgi:hypothetical protein
MRNDARPLGESSPASPVGGDEAPIPSHPSDGRDSVTDDRQSHIVHKDSEDRQPQNAGDPVTPQSTPIKP